MEEKQAQIEIMKYRQLGFNEEQLIEIKAGLLDGLDVTTYARLDISAADMNHIRKSLYFNTNATKSEDIQKELEKADLVAIEEPQEKKQQEIKKQNIELATIAIVICAISIILSVVFLIKRFM